MCFFFYKDTATTEIYTLSLHDALLISPMDMPVDQGIVRALVSGYKQVTGHEPQGVGPPATQLGGRYGDDDAHLWEAGIPAPIYGPSGGSYGDDYADIDEMVLCNKVLALAALEMCG